MCSSPLPVSCTHKSMTPAPLVPIFVSIITQLTNDLDPSHQPFKFDNSRIGNSSFSPVFEPIFWWFFAESLCVGPNYWQTFSMIWVILKAQRVGPLYMREPDPTEAATARLPSCMFTTALSSTSADSIRKNYQILFGMFFLAQLPFHLWLSDSMFPEIRFSTGPPKILSGIFANLSYLQNEISC